MRTTLQCRGTRCLICALLLGAIFFLGHSAALAQGARAAAVQLDEAKLRSKVQFPGIDGPVYVTPLSYAAGKDPNYMEYALPRDVVDKIIRARDRNAFWLVREARRDSRSVSYTLEITKPGIRTYTYPVSGRYDRGVWLLLPSEYILYDGNVSAYEYEDTPDYFKMRIMPSAEKGNHGIPDYRYWLSTVTAVRPIGYQTWEHISWILGEPKDPPYHNGYELWFAKDDLRLEKEFLLRPAEVEADDGTKLYDFDDPEVLVEVTYNYLEGAYDYPAYVSLVNVDGVHYANGINDKLTNERWYNSYTTLRFGMVDGLWMLQKGSTYDLGSGESEGWDLIVYDVSVER